jgi:hypothetical protein
MLQDPGDLKGLRGLKSQKGPNPERAVLGSAKTALKFQYEM